MSLIKSVIAEHIELAGNMHLLEHDIAFLAQECIETLNLKGKILICGNGGSASDAQHIAAELTGRFLKERKGLSAVALTTDTSAITAIGNDYGFDHIYSRQVEAIARPEDLLIGISTSGNSANVIKAIEAAQKIGCTAWGLSGRNGGQMCGLLCDRNIVIPSQITARIQEMHIMVGHLVCEIVENANA